MQIRTMGRWPTLGEMVEYYSRDDICAAIYYQTKHWKVITQVKDKQALEPTSEKHTRALVIDRLNQLTQGLKETQRLPRYLAMHILRDHGEGAQKRYDFSIEGDFPSWTQAFRNMAKALDLLEQEGVFYQVKFSGSRSLHLIIPAEVFPAEFCSKPINEQFPSIEKKLKAYLPITGNVTAGLRTVYSVHPQGGLVSVPLYRRALPSFQPWMANIHTVAVDFDWFVVPKDAVEQTRGFLHKVFGAGRQTPRVCAPRFDPLPVSTYAGEVAMPPAAIGPALGGTDPFKKIEAGRAAFIQGESLSISVLKAMLSDPEADLIWFGMEILIRDLEAIAAEDLVMLLDLVKIIDRKNWDDQAYIKQYQERPATSLPPGLWTSRNDILQALFDRLLRSPALDVDRLLAYLETQRQISRYTVVAVYLIREIDLVSFVDLAVRIEAGCLSEWFEKVWVVCGSAICLDGEGPLKQMFEKAYAKAHGFAEADDRTAAKIAQLRLLYKLHNDQPFQKMDQELIRHSAAELVEIGFDLQIIATSMLERGTYSYVYLGGVTLLAQTGCTDLLIEEYSHSLSKRGKECIQEALVSIGSAAVGPLLGVLADQDARERVPISRIIVAIGAAAVGPLILLLGAADSEIRWRAASMLGKLGTSAGPAVAALGLLLADEDEGVRDHAAIALRKIPRR